ncbi:MAG: HAMP domain-containing sensor histidine kinase [Vicinamibacterales bacterium]
MTERSESGGIAPPPAWLERANRLSLLARLVSSTIHDVNNALQVIGGGVELVQMKPADPEAVTRAIGGQAERANRLLQDLSRFTRDTGGPPEPINVLELAEQALAMRHFALTRLRATRGVSGEPVTVRAVRRDVLQVVLNLLVNAELALPGTTGPALRIGVSAGDGVVRVSVEDNGPGIPESDRDTVFCPRTPAAEGAVDRLGIGLAVSRALARRQGGELAYAPVDPAGARFTLTLPASGS